MKRATGLILIVFFFVLKVPAQDSGKRIPLPTPGQLRYQNYEQIMFVCLDPCTWQGREYDNHSILVDEMLVKILYF